VTEEEEDPVSAWTLEDVVGDHELEANAWLLANGKIQVDQSFRDVEPGLRDRILRNPDGFLKAIGSGVAA